MVNTIPAIPGNVKAMLVEANTPIKKNKLAAKKQEREARGAKKMKAKAIRAERKLKEQSRV